MPLIYDFSFPLAAAGLSCTVRDDAGTTVHTATLGTTVDDKGEIVLQVALPEGDYVAAVKETPGGGITSRWQSPGFLDVPESLDQPGASETAKFIGTVTADTSGDSFDMVFAQDPDGIVDWAEEVAGNIKLTGPIQFHINARQGGTLDFTDATGFSTADTPPEVEGFVNYLSDTGGGNRSCWNDYKIPLGAVGDTFAIDAPLSSNSPSGPNFNSANHEVTISATVTAHGYDAAGDPVTDGVYDAVFVVWVTKSELPDLPA